MSLIIESLRRAEAALPACGGRLDNLKPDAGAFRQSQLDQLPHVRCKPQLGAHVLYPRDSLASGVEQFRLLNHVVRKLGMDRSVRTVLITSALPREGKTVVAINLATLLAQSGSRVLLADCDTRSAGIQRTLGLSDTAGLADIVQGAVDWLSVLQWVDPLGFCYMSPGHPPENPVELMQAPRMHEIVHLARTFDWVILDSPPLNPFADTHCLIPLADAILLVVRAGVTDREDFAEAVRSLARAPLACVILNGHERPDRSAYYSYRRQAGEGLRGAAPALRLPSPGDRTGAPGHHG